MKRFLVSMMGAICLLPVTASGGITAGSVKRGIPKDAARAAVNGNQALVEPPRGSTYDNLTGPFWQWALGIPAGRNPLIDPDGRDCGVGQEGPVWFLAGSFGDPVTRTCNVPAGRHVFMPVYISGCSAPAPSIATRASQVCRATWHNSRSSPPKT